MSEFNLADRFPEMRPIRTPPSLGTLNGVGMMMVGSRDRDDETGTHVKTHSFCVLFVPLLALGAYRVFDAPEGGWYFLGRVPLSPFARGWNWLMGLLVLFGAGLGGWFTYTGTEGYAARQQIARADRLVAEGLGREPAGIYRQVMAGPTEHAGTARDRLTALLDAPPDDLTEAAGVFQVAVDLHREEKCPVKDPCERAVALVRKQEESDPKGALTLLEVVAPLASQPAEHLAHQRRLLERLVQQSPDDVRLASRLAVACDSLGDLKRCEAILRRHENQLADLDGAAILGRIYAAQGKNEAAHKLLTTYLDSRLPQLRVAESSYNTAYENVKQRVITRVQEGKVTDFDFVKFRAAGKGEQMALLNAYLAMHAREDSTLRKASATLREHRAVVPAALELGMVRLHRAQGMANPEARRQELQKAEEVLRSVQGLAGESDRYRLDLGQVYYWLGKHAEGKKLFDEVLTRNNRASDLLVLVARLLREVGSATEARKLSEEAYTKEPDQDKKHQVALFRSVLFTDLDDKILWLGRSNPGDLEVMASLGHARGSKAIQDGKDDEAVAQFRQALAHYAKMPETVASLNNAALVHFSLYQLTQDREQLQRGTDKLDRAIALKPGDSILLQNAAAELSGTIARDLIGNAIDWKVLKRGADLDLLSFLYTDEAGLERFVTRTRGHPGLGKLKNYHERLLVLAPKSSGSYSDLAGLHRFLRDLEGLQSVKKRLQGVELDLGYYESEMRDWFAGKNEDKKREEFKKNLVRQEEIVRAARKVGGATLAVAASRLATAHLGMAVFGLPVDADLVVRLAEEADAAATSSATRSVRIEATSFRAHQRLAREDREYAELARKTRRSLGHVLLTWVLSREGPLRDRALADADVKEATRLRLERVKAFPGSPSPTAWAFLHSAHPEEAARIAKGVQANERDALKRAIDRILSPLSSSNAVEEHWALVLAGKRTEADALMKEFAGRGVPLP